MSDAVYLKDNVVAEPLFNQWYAWSYLMSPASAAMTIANLHVPLMKSFVTSPRVHERAAKNPALLGGKFLAHSEAMVPAVQTLLNKTLAEQQVMLDLAEAIASLNGILSETAKGHGLDNLYQRVPPMLKGYVELAYDLNNQASVRFIEALLYKSRYYDESRQSLHVYTVHDDDRPFVLSTPRLEDGAGLQINLPFRDERVQMFFRMKTEPQRFDHIADALGMEGEQRSLLRNFMTETAAPPQLAYDGAGVRMRYFGHAAVLLETSNTSILFDPNISYPIRNATPRFNFEDLPPVIDYLIITHNHQDHVLLESLLQLRHSIRHIVCPRNGGGFLQDPSLKLMFENLGFPTVIELAELESLKIPDGEILGVPFLGEHSDLSIHTKLGYHVRLFGQKFLFLVDSCNLEPELYAHLHKLLGNVDALFIGMECEGAPLSWLYSPLFSRPITRGMDQSRRLNGSDFAQAIRIIEQFAPEHVFIYAMGQEPWMKHIMSLEYTPDSRPIVESDKLVAERRARGQHAERLFCKREIIYHAKA